MTQSLKDKAIEQEIKKIVTYSSDEGTSGYLLSQDRIDELSQLFKETMLEVIGEDDDSAGGRFIAADIRNNFRAELREAIKNK